MAEDLLQLLAKKVIGKLGLNPKEAAKSQETPRFDMVENVEAPLPSKTAPWPKNLPEILFGSKTKLPAGTHINSSMKPGKFVGVLKDEEDLWLNPKTLELFNKYSKEPWKVYPTSDSDLKHAESKAKKALNTFSNMFPYAARTFNKVGIDPTMSRYAVIGKKHPNETIGLSSDLAHFPDSDVLDTLAHEVAHSSFYKNFNTLEDAREASAKRDPNSNSLLTDPVGEQQAYEVARQLTQQLANRKKK